MDIGLDDKNIEIIKKLIGMKEIEFLEKYRNYKDTLELDSECKNYSTNMLKNKKEQMNNFKNLYNYLENLKLTFNKNQRELNQLMFEQELIREKMNNLKKTLDVLS
jgi:hypothetical protein